jgi:ethanolamine ammonia-lyase small subunit
MTKLIRRGLVIVFVLLATLLIAHLWLTRPDMFPRLPERLWLSLDRLYGVQDGEDAADLEIVVALGLSFIAVLSLTGIAYWISRTLKRL